MTIPTLVAIAAATNFTGVVTFSRGDIPFCFVQEQSGAVWRVECKEGLPPDAGSEVAVCGTIEPSIKPRIENATVEKRGSAPIPSPQETTIEEIFKEIMPYGISSWYGRTLSVEGMLRDINRRKSTTQLLVGEGEQNIQVEIPYMLEESLPPKLVLGARVRVTGALAYTSIENIEDNVYGRIENVELIPMSKNDVKVVKRAPKPPFWTGKRVAAAGGITAGVIAILLVWLATLRSMVRKRTNELAESIREKETTKIEADAARRERLRLAADLHDGFQQYLAGAMFRLKAAANYLPAEASKSREQLDMVRQALQHTQNGLRATLWAMNEESEGPESLTELLQYVSHRMAHWDKIVKIVSRGQERKVARKCCGSLLLVVQEAVGNAIRHGRAKSIEVRVEFSAAMIELAVKDDGCGFDASRQDAGHYGLKTMERRVTELGGTMHIDSSPGKGTCVRFEIPNGKV